MSCKSLLLCTECRYSSLLSCKHKHKEIWICLSVPGLTWRQIVTGLADDCSSLIGAPWPQPSSPRPAAWWRVRWGQPLITPIIISRPGGNQSPHTSPPLLSWAGFLLDQKAAFETISQHHFLAYCSSLLCRPWTDGWHQYPWQYPFTKFSIFKTILQDNLLFQVLKNCSSLYLD